MTKHQDIARILDQNTVFAATVSVGNSTLNVFSNSTIIKLANSTVNTGIVVPTAAQYSGSYYLHANGTWQLVAAGATPGGANTQVQFNDSTSLGGTAGFTFNKDTNNAVIANTLTVGSGTINTTNYSGTANNALNLGGTAAASYQLNSTLAANVVTLASNSTTYIPATNGIVSNSTGVWITANAGLLTNSTGLHIGTGNGMVIDTDSIRVLPNTGIVVNSTGVFVNATYIGTLDANNAAFLGGTAAASYQLNSTLAANVATMTANNATWHGTSVFANSTGAYPTSNSVGAVLGNTISRVIITGNSATFTSTLAAGDTTITGFVNATVSVNSAAHTIGSTLIANTLGVYHTGIVNAASYTTTGFLANATHVVPTSNSSGQTFGNTISRWVMTANSLTVSGGASPDSNTLGTALGTTTQRWILTANSADIGPNFVANSLGAYHTATVNAASFTTTGFLANTTGVFPASNTVGQNFGNTIARWVITGNSATFTSTLAAGDTTITGAMNATVSVNSALVTVGTAFIANTLGSYHTGTMNAASFTTTGFRANTIGVYPTSNTVGQLLGNTISRWELVGNTIDTTGTATIANTLAVTTSVNSALFTTTGFRANTIGVYPTSNSSGQLFGNTISRWAIFANTLDITTSITANGALGTATQLLTSNSLGGVYWAAPSGGGNVTKVGTPADDQVGVWTGDGTIEGTAGFTFSAASNNAAIANTLTVGTATVNSTLANVSALNVINQTNTATLFVTTSANVGTAVLANSIGLTTTGFVNATTVVNSASHTIGSTLIANTLGVYHTGIVNAASHTTTGFLANATHVVATSNSSGQTLGNTISRWVITANSLVTSGGVSPDSNTLGTALGTTTQRWILTANSADIGPNFVANTLGAYHTAVMNAASHTTTGVTANVTGVFCTSNSSGQNLGNTIARWVLLANTIESTGLANVSALNVVNQTNTGTFFATTSANVGANVQVNTTSIIVGNSITNTLIGNTSVDIGNSVGNTFANSILLRVANATANVVLTPDRFFSGNSTVNLFANSIILKLANSTSNTSISVPTAADWAGSKFLHANGSWAAPVAAAAAGGSNTHVQYNDSTAIGGSAGFTFDKTTNNVFFANTLQSGNSTVNAVANSTTLLFSNSTTETISANSAALAIGNSTVNNTLNSVCIAINMSPTANLTSNTVIVQLANSSGTSNLTPTSLAIATSLLANSTGLYPGSNTVGQLLGNTISRWDIDAISLNLAAGNSTVAPVMLTSGTNLTTAAAGAVEFDGKCFYSSAIASTRQVADCEQLITLTTAFTLANQTAAQKMFNAPTNGAVTVGASTTYFFDCSFSLTAMSASSNSFGFALAGTATYTRQAWWAVAAKTVGAPSLAGAASMTYNTAAQLALTSGTTSANGSAKIWGKLVIGTGGTIIPQISLQSAAAAVVGNDSYFRIWPAGLNTVQSVGNWS